MVGGAGPEGRCHFGAVLPRPGEGVSSGGPRREELRAFCRALAEATGTPVRSHRYETYGALLKKLDWGVVDLAWLPPLVALRAIDAAGAVPVAVPIRAAAPWFWSALFVRADSPVRELRDLHGTRAVWVDRESASGYQLPRAALRAAGVEPDRVFAEQVFAKTHDAVARSVLSDPGSVGATYVHLDEDGNVQHAAWGGADVRRLKTAGPIPADLLAASSTAVEEIVRGVRDALVGGADQRLVETASALFFAERFASVDRSHTAHLQALGRSLFGVAGA